MENATKALLIAFGMKIFNSTSDVAGQATSTGKALGNHATAAANSAVGAVNGLSNWTK